MTLNLGKDLWGFEIVVQLMTRRENIIHLVKTRRNTCRVVTDKDDGIILQRPKTTNTNCVLQNDDEALYTFLELPTALGLLLIYTDI